ncbi:type II/IV secretion system ATPase subunit [Candidatus Woesearchaeota archaeon]|nr:type II/IV secretion system ATPase subunit [Candidatus Woesearchaeota archaeon]
MAGKDKAVEGRQVIETYSFVSNNIPITISIFRAKNEFVPVYEPSISKISKNTELILEKIRQEMVTQVNLGMADILDTRKSELIEQSFRKSIEVLVKKHFPDADKATIDLLIAYLVQKSLGMGNVEILMSDGSLEEVAINSSDEPVWVYHRKHGWLKTTIALQSEDQIRHFAAMIGRKVGRQITILEPLMDANLSSGNRVNATLTPVSLHGNTLTFRKFASKPWTITDFIQTGSISAEAASLVWLAVQYELSTIIAGGTASGKTSALNVISNFFPPNQRIISIEDTHEIQLPRFLHWVPMITRLSNVEGRGNVSMLDLLVNSLRMRPDRIIVGEIRRKKEAEVLFEAIHTGHSVYATMHANNAKETINRLTNPPIEIPKTLIPAVSLLVVQYRNRRIGLRRTFQIAEILPDATPNVLMQLDIAKDRLVRVNRSVALMDTLQLYTGVSRAAIERDLKDKERVLDWLVKQKVNSVDGVGRVIAEYYTNNNELMKLVRSNKPLPGAKDAAEAV